MTVSDIEFIRIVEAAADFDDYRCAKFFVPRQRSHRMRQGFSAARADAPRAQLSPQSAITHICKSLGVNPAGDPFGSRTDTLLQVRNPAVLPVWARELREMFDGLREENLATKQTSPLYRLCECGSRYGLQRLKGQISSDVLNRVSQKAKESLNRDLRRTLARVTRPCFALRLEALRLASEALQAQETGPKDAERTRVGTMRSEQLCSMFKTFPVLAKLWSQLISQWCNQIADLLLRFTTDRRTLSNAFLCGQRIGKIINLHSGLSDPHNGGGTTAFLQFERGSVIYKPRRGDGEWEWIRFLQWMNSQSFQPKLRGARVLRREGYCWMEHIQPKPCKDQDAARRFYTRVGGLLAAACLLRAVDCHRDNMIASGEYPVLVDAETLWHVARETRPQTCLDALYETGFLASPDRRSSHQYLSSALGRTTPGAHTPQIGANPLNAARYEIEIVNGFRKAWRCLLGTKDRRTAFLHRLQRLRRRTRRWIYWPTRNYDAIRRACIQPVALRSGINRDFLIAGLCARSAVSQMIIRREINALKRLDVPYFVRKSSAIHRIPESRRAPAEIIEGLRHALHI